MSSAPLFVRHSRSRDKTGRVVRAGIVSYMADEHVSECLLTVDSFTSYASLHRDLRTLEMAMKRVPGRVACANRELVYCTIYFAWGRSIRGKEQDKDLTKSK